MTLSRCAVATAIALCSFSTYADEPADEILIVGSLTPISAAELGASVTVFDADDIRQRQDFFLPDLLRGMPGVAITQSGATGLTEIRIRGAEADHSLTLLDGIEVTDPASIGTVIDYSHLSTANVGRVVLLRGAQSSFYGADALGGVIAIETPALFGRDDTYIEGEAGSFGTRRYGAGLTRSNDSVGVHVSYSNYETDGFNAVTNGSEKDNADRELLHAKLGMKLSDGLELNIVGLRSDIFTNTDGFGGVDSNTDQVAVVRKAGRAALTYETADRNWRIDAAAQLMASQQDFLFGGFAAASDGLRQKRDLQVSRRFVAGNFEHRVTAAYQTEKESVTAGGNKFLRQQNSIVGEYRLVTNAGHAGSVSVRHDDNKSYEDFTSWRAQAVVQLAEMTRLHASAGTGIKAPDFTEFSNQFGCTPNFDLKPEKSRSYDVGVTHDVDHRAVSGQLDVTYFDATLEDEVKFCFAAPFSAQSTNQVGESKRKGIEVSGGFILPHMIMADLSYTWLDAEEPSGVEEPRRPEHSGSLTLSRHFVQDRLLASMTYTYSGDTVDNNRQAIRAYDLVNLALSYSVSDEVALTARATNLFDETYVEAVGFATAGRGVFVGLRASLGD